MHISKINLDEPAVGKNTIPGLLAADNLAISYSAANDFQKAINGRCEILQRLELVMQLT
jgi:hypothetical protein